MMCPIQQRDPGLQSVHSKGLHAVETSLMGVFWATTLAGVDISAHCCRIPIKQLEKRCGAQQNKAVHVHAAK